LQVKTVVPLLVAAHLHDLGKLKKACVELIKANVTIVIMSTLFIELKTNHPLLWKEMRAALGHTEDDDQDDEDEDEEQEG